MNEVPGSNTEKVDENAGASDEENEEQWRKLRYEREQLLKQQTTSTGTEVTVGASRCRNKCLKNKVSFDYDLQVTETVMETSEQSISVTLTHTTPSAFRQISVAQSSAVSSPFLLNKTGLDPTFGRKSFLHRDTKTLERLALITKQSGDGETITNISSGKGNYVFVATEKKTVSYFPICQ